MVEASNNTHKALGAQHSTERSQHVAVGTKTAQLTPEQKQEFFAQAQKLRRELHQDMGHERIHAEAQRHLGKFSEHPVVKQFIADIDKWDFTRTAEVIHETGSEKIAGFFEETDRDPDKFFEAVVVDRKHKPTTILTDVSEPGFSPVDVLHATEGYNGPHAGVLFPTDFMGVEEQKEGFDFFFFVNTFMRRFVDTTWENRKKVNIDDQCGLIKVVDKVLEKGISPELEQAFVDWFNVHEVAHSTGRAPLRPFLSLKTYNNCASAIEELRAALMLHATANEKYEEAEDPAIKENIFLILGIALGARLFRYPVEMHPSADYDALASELLYRGLKRSGGLEYRSSPNPEERKLTIKPYEQLSSIFLHLLNLVSFADSNMAIHHNRIDEGLKDLPFSKIAQIPEAYASIIARGLVEAYMGPIKKGFSRSQFFKENFGLE